MKKVVKVLIPVIIVLVVLALAFFVGAKQDVEKISYKDYQKIKENSGYVYYGSEENMNALKSLADQADLEISILDPKDLSESEIKTENLEEGVIYLYEDGKVVYTYDGNLSDYKLMQSLMNENLIDKTYLTITLDDYLEIIKEDGYHFMFIGSDTCGYCTQFKESINETLKDYNYNVYYLNIGNFSEEDVTKLYETDSYFTENAWGTPLNFLYKDGERIDVLSGYVDANELTKFLQENKVI